MIRQHLLQKERLKYNHERLLERYYRLLPQPNVSEFRAFGSSSLPGRNYSEHLRQINGKTRHEPSDIALISRSRVTSPDREIDFWIEKESREQLPKGILSTIEHRRIQQASLVNAEKFEPVKIYEHPLFGPTPAYIKPLFRDDIDPQMSNSDNNESDDDGKENSDDTETTSTKRLRSESGDEKNEKQTQSIKSENDDDSEDKIPAGYISYKRWKEKYQNLIPVNPLLFKIYSQRSKNSIQAYGRSLSSLSNRTDHKKTSKKHHSSSSSDSSSESDDESTSTSSRYDKLNPKLIWKASPLPLISSNTSKSFNQNDIKDSSSPPESPVPFLSKRQPVMSGSIASVSNNDRKPSFTYQEKEIDKPVTKKTESGNIQTPSSVTSLTKMSADSNILSKVPAPPGIASLSSEKPIQANTNNSSDKIPPAPPLPSSLSDKSLNANNSSVNIPPAPPLLSSFSSKPINANTNNSSNAIPPAPPLPSSLPDKLLNTNSSSGKIPPAPPLPSSLSDKSLSKNMNNSSTKIPTTSSMVNPTNMYQAPSNLSATGSVSKFGGDTQKSVKFGLDSALKVSTVEEELSSTDSDDSVETKRRKKKQKKRAAGLPDNDSSSSDD